MFIQNIKNKIICTIPHDINLDDLILFFDYEDFKFCLKNNIFNDFYLYYLFTKIVNDYNLFNLFHRYFKTNKFLLAMFYNLLCTKQITIFITNSYNEKDYLNKDLFDYALEYKRIDIIDILLKQE